MNFSRTIGNNVLLFKKFYSNLSKNRAALSKIIIEKHGHAKPYQNMISENIFQKFYYSSKRMKIN